MCHRLIGNLQIFFLLVYLFFCFESLQSVTLYIRLIQRVINVIVSISKKEKKLQDFNNTNNVVLFNCLAILFVGFWLVFGWFLLIGRRNTEKQIKLRLFVNNEHQTFLADVFGFKIILAELNRCSNQIEEATLNSRQQKGKKKSFDSSLKKLNKNWNKYK